MIETSVLEIIFCVIIYIRRDHLLGHFKLC